jgi:hypothetical protein
MPCHAMPCHAMQSMLTIWLIPEMVAGDHSY